MAGATLGRHMTRWSPHPVTLRQLQYESALGVTLFERLPRGVVVTKVGRAVLDRARHTLASWSSSRIRRRRAGPREARHRLTARR